MGGLHIKLILPSYGVYYFIGDNKLEPNYLDMNGALVGGHTTYITVEKLAQSHLPLPYNNCERNLNSNSPGFTTPYFKSATRKGFQYRQINCYQECFRYYIAKICNCSIPGKTYTVRDS